MQEQLHRVEQRQTGETLRALIPRGRYGRWTKGERLSGDQGSMGQVVHISQEGLMPAGGWQVKFHKLQCCLELSPRLVGPDER